MVYFNTNTQETPKSKTIAPSYQKRRKGKKRKEKKNKKKKKENHGFFSVCLSSLYALPLVHLLLCLYS